MRWTIGIYACATLALSVGAGLCSNSLGLGLIVAGTCGVIAAVVTVLVETGIESARK